jgi:hypothetical protein
VQPGRRGSNLEAAAADAVLHQLEPLACRHFDTVADAMHWFRDRDAELQQP